MNIKISYNWLKEYLKTDKSVFDVAKELSLKGQSVERINEVGKGLGGVLVGKILTIEKHPNADKLSIAKVDIGKKSPLQIVFGQMAKINIGDRLPVAIAPTTLPTGQVIKKSNLRGVESEGMLCLDSELGLSSQDHLTLFDENVIPGTSLTKVMGLADYILEIEVTSNRPDAMSVVGLAREAAAALKIKDNIKVPQPNLKISGKEIPLSVEVKEKDLCPRYNAVVMTDIKIGPSPLWLQTRLLASGFRPINNLADITNYILLEYGRPMHVFDYDKLDGQKIIVRKAKSKEMILALDGKSYELKPWHLVIADNKNPVAVAGIMGGELSGATEKTKTIVFECAAFDPVLIRKTARELNLHSDSSDLFEKNLHPETTFVGLLRAIELTQELAGGKVASPIIDIYAESYKPNKVKFDTANVKRYLGVDIAISEIKNILESLGFIVSGAKMMNVTVPYWRANDVEFEHDLVEEVARIYGYHNLPTELPQGEIPLESRNPLFFWEDRIKDSLGGLGFSESLNYSMVSDALLKKAGFSGKEAIKIDNPLNEEMEYMRPTLIPGILQNVSDNLNNFTELKIFELSNIYVKIKENDLPSEVSKLTAAVVAEKETFLQVKGVVEFLLKKLGILDYEMKPTDSACPLWQTGECLDIFKGKKFLGQFGLFKQDILEKFGIKKSVGLFDFEIPILLEFANTVKSFQPVPEYPCITRDLSIIVNQEVSWKEISQQVSQANRLIIEVEYLNTFTDESLGKDKKSIALRMVFRAIDRTLKSEEVDQIVDKVVKKLEKSFEAKLR